MRKCNATGSGRGSQFASILHGSNVPRAMKLFALLFLVLCAEMAVEGVPLKKKAEPNCAIRCSTDDYSPVCAGIPNDKSVKPKLFGNECVLDKHNCENKSNLVKISEDECKGVMGIRLF